MAHAQKQNKAQSDNPLTFTVRRHAPELIVPAKPTPHELKPLSDIDDQETLRVQTSSIQIYHGNPNMGNKNPTSVIREALAKLLVFYYPFAGRLKEGPGRKLMVDCAGQGMLFIEAEADVTLKQFGYPLLPPFPHTDELLYDVPGSSNILDAPLLLIQVTRLLCGGFIFALRLNHTMSDAKGKSQFIIALTEIARGASTPSLLPVWQREILFARDPPRITSAHLKLAEIFDTDHNYDKITPQDDMAYKSFIFGSTEISAIRRLLPAHLMNRTTFDVLTAYLWRCRTIALQPNPKDIMRLAFAFSVRGKFKSFIPVGYYGNAFVTTTAICTAEELSNKPLSHALDLVMKAKYNVTEEYTRCLADLMVIKNRPLLKLGQSYVVSDVTQLDFDVVDFGWGKPAYAGPMIGAFGNFSIYTPYINNKGESGIVVPICLPSAAMGRFTNELNNILVQDDNNVLNDKKLPVLSRL